MENQNPSSLTLKEHFHFGHFSFVFVVAVMLIGIAWLKDPAIFTVFHQSKKVASHLNIPRYYAYVPPPEYSQPQVAGASTTSYDGPSVINEDGTISPAVDLGEVLGVSTEDINLSLDAVKVNAVADGDTTIQNYIKKSQEIESSYIETSEFEMALASQDQKQIDQQQQKFSKMLVDLQNLVVPKSFEKMHKIKIVQYQAVIEILKNFVQADQNPELVNKYLGIFLQTQQLLETEANNLTDLVNKYQTNY